jgi:hypothetical protein
MDSPRAVEFRPVTLSDDDIALLLEALDSHVYWQLSDPQFRQNGDVRDPGSDDPDQVAAIRHAGAAVSAVVRGVAASASAAIRDRDLVVGQHLEDAHRLFRHLLARSYHR